jgi:arabinose-5-phosphate isomerase
MSAKSSTDILASAQRTLNLEADGLHKLALSIDVRFSAAVQRVLKSKGRLVVTGIGKSGNIAQKMVATLVSTGQPAVFMHAADAIHGDLGTIQKHDVVLCISKSGD